jgi:hypothetical protein
MGKCHNFKDCLEFSHAAEEWPIWEEVYQKAFPTMQAMLNHRQDGDHQRQGIDRSVILRNGKQILIDEKVRQADYDDILLEVWSDRVRKKPGWVAKDLLCDYIAYAILPRSVCYLLPVPQLRRAWQQKGSYWWANNFRPIAKNEGYETESVVVPTQELLSEIKNALVIDYSGGEPQ